MTNVAAIAGYALQEALRRRVFLVVLVLTTAFLGLFWLGASTAFDEVRIDLDEVLFTPFGPEGMSKDGTIRCKLKITEAGDLTVRLHGYETK